MTIDTPQFKEQLASERKIAVIWSADDVKGVCPNLTDDQCWQVLQSAEKCHDAVIGINWDVLKTHADALFPESAEEITFAKRLLARRLFDILPGSNTP